MARQENYRSTLNFSTFPGTNSTDFTSDNIKKQDICMSSPRFCFRYEIIYTMSMTTIGRMRWSRPYEYIMPLYNMSCWIIDNRENLKYSWWESQRR